MITAFPSIYHDKHGTDKTVIYNNGKTLTMMLRGIEFVGSMFDDFELQEPEKSNLNLFSLHRGSLCSCEIDCEIPIQIIMAGNSVKSHLYAHIELGCPKREGGIEYEKIKLSLLINGETYQSSGLSGWFDDELRELQNLLPSNIHIKICYTCAFSAYSPAGYGSFGCLACFRENKQQFRAIQNKTELMNFFSKHTEIVQETWLCSEYEFRANV